MSTKDLSRTPIEGGRIPRYKFDRKSSLRSSRHHNNISSNYIVTHWEEIEYSGKYQDDIENDPYFNAFNSDYVERKHNEYSGNGKFKDRLGPINRWMESRVGISWDETYSLIRDRFDARTTAGRHIIFDHMLGQVWTSQNRSDDIYRYYSYYVDSNGILQKKEPSKYTIERLEEKHIAKLEYIEPKIVATQKKIIPKWLGIRKIGWVGKDYYWYVPTSRPTKTLQFSWNVNKLSYYDWGWNTNKPLWGFHYSYKVKDELIWCEWYTGWRQDKKFSKEDLEYFWSLAKVNREELLKGRPLSSQEMHEIYRKKRAQERLIERANQNVLDI